MFNFKKSKSILVFSFAAIIIIGSLYYFDNKKKSVLNITPAVNLASTTRNNNLSTQDKIPATAEPVSAPENISSLNLPIPFTPQAPSGNWDLLHNEACEEASAIMANAYLKGDKDIIIPVAQVEGEINSLTTWLDQRFGYHLNTTALETAQMIEGFYGLQAEVFDDYTLQDIKDQLNLQKVIILPVNGRVIGNPNYKPPGPIYHMLVIRGYTTTGLITNDSGTKRGLNYPYAFETLHNAGADWDHNIDTIDQSKKLMIVVSK